jgi:hypothetical protein
LSPSPRRMEFSEVTGLPTRFDLSLVDGERRKAEARSGCLAARVILTHAATTSVAGQEFHRLGKLLPIRDRRVMGGGPAKGRRASAAPPAPEIS